MNIPASVAMKCVDYLKKNSSQRLVHVPPKNELQVLLSSEDNVACCLSINFLNIKLSRKFV